MKAPTELMQRILRSIMRACPGSWEDLEHKDFSVQGLLCKECMGLRIQDFGLESR